MDWPKPGEILFKADADWRFNACIDHNRFTLAVAAVSYREGAMALARAVASGDAVLDRAILPIVYLYRQYLELVIKDIIDTARQVELEGEDYPKTHDLNQLWTEAARLIRKHYGKDAPLELDYIKPCIDEFHSHDPGSFAFRYPTDKDGNTNLRGITHINLKNLYDTMERLSSFLDCIAGDLGHKLDWMYEMQSENQ